jgi:hypothetical protein
VFASSAKVSFSADFAFRIVWVISGSMVADPVFSVVD